MLTNLLEKHASDFEMRKIIEPEHLEECRRTTFSYTKMPSGLCLAADKKYFNQGLDNPNIKGIVALPSAVVRRDRYKKTIIVANRGAELFYFLHNYPIHEFAEWESKPVKRHIAATAKKGGSHHLISSTRLCLAGYRYPGIISGCLHIRLNYRETPGIKNSLC